jgi:hypothetical protein
MSETARKSVTAFGLALALGLGLVGLSRAHDGREHPAATHGGTLEKTEHYQFEVVCASDGLKVYPRGTDGKALDASKLTGTATFYHPNSPQPWFERKLKAVASGAGRAPESLDLGIDMSKAPAKGVKVALEVAGLPDPAEPKATFTVPFAAPVKALAPAVITYGRATSADHAAIDAQRVCKISGQDLFGMGGPLKVSRGDKSIFICCRSCLKKIQANPDKYLGATSASDPVKTR